MAVAAGAEERKRRPRQRDGNRAGRESHRESHRERRHSAGKRLAERQPSKRGSGLMLYRRL